jgi:hypothetical protein
LCVYNHLFIGKIFCLLPLNCLVSKQSKFSLVPHFLSFHFGPLFFYFFLKRGNINVNSKSALTNERVESRFFFKKIKFFGKEAKTDANTLKTCFLGFFNFFYLLVFFLKKRGLKIGLQQRGECRPPYKHSIKAIRPRWVMKTWYEKK